MSALDAEGLVEARQMVNGRTVLSFPLNTTRIACFSLTVWFVLIAPVADDGLSVLVRPETVEVDENVHHRLTVATAIENLNVKRSNK